MKAKNEKDFAMIRVKRDTIKKIKQINARDQTGKHIKLYETVERIVDKEWSARMSE